MTLSSDEKYSPIWDSFLSENNEAFSLIYTENVQSLFLYGMKFSNDRQLVQDCVQEVFVQIYRNRENLGRTSNVKFYLFRILKNILLNVFKREQIHEKSLSSLDPTDFVDNSLIYELEQKEIEVKTKEQVVYLLSLLTERQRTAIYYRYIEGIEIEEICNKMDMKYQSVSNLLHRSLVRIKDLIGDSEPSLS